MEAPIYLDAYILCKPKEPGAFEVFFHTEEGGYTDFIRKATIKEALDEPVKYCLVEHETGYPYSAVDASETDTAWNARTQLSQEIFNEKPQRLEFCQAEIVLTPKMKLI